MLDIDDILKGTVVKSVDIGLLVQGSPVPLTTVNVVANITDMVGKFYTKRVDSFTALTRSAALTLL